jgi:hypothetical protein
MRRGAILLAIALPMLACGGSSSGASHSPSPSAVASATVSSSAGPSPSPGPLTGVYGLLLSAGTLYLIKPDASEGGSVTVAAPSVQSCGQGMAAVLQPPVSASQDEVYFRDGDTKIRMVVPPTGAVDVTTVPGGPKTISFFSVSPDDQRIAVVVEDLSGSTSVGLRLYTEDLRGGGHHAEIFATSAPRAGGTTLWPMGWHQGRLVLAIWPVCTLQQVPYPSSWHVVDASSANRLATIGDASCVPSVWPSPAGVACFDATGNGTVRVYDWAGKQVAALQTKIGVSELSPSGRLLAAGNGGGLGNPSPTTTMIGTDGGGSVASLGHMACLWFDDSHALAQDAVIAYPSGAATVLAQSGECAGRFPGEL